MSATETIGREVTQRTPPPQVRHIFMLGDWPFGKALCGARSSGEPCRVPWEKCVVCAGLDRP